MSETVLVTGTGGFIGFHLTKRLIAEGNVVIGIDNFNDYYEPTIKEERSKILKASENYHEFRIDLCDYEALDNVFKQFKIDKVCNLAAQAILNCLKTLSNASKSHKSILNS
jgi:UDP-glucuronate 4-epimerase